MVDLEATLRASLEGQYAIEGEVGRGGMSVVYRARDLKHSRTVAIKVLRPELSEQIAAERFHREIEVVAGLTHPHILPLHDSGEAGGHLYYVMPYIEGESLRARVDRESRLPVPDAIRVAREIAGALWFAHRQGVIHRDVKPGNILLAEDHALLADFGVAHLAETDGGTLTGTGLTLGTPSYFSPEQATGEQDIDGRSDIYSLGCVLYEALTGEPPFAGNNVRALIKQHVVDAPPRARNLRPEVSEGLEAVVQTALQKEPFRRFQTAKEMAGSLDLVSGGFEAMAASALRKLLGPRFRWLHGTRLALLVASAVLVILVGLVAIRPFIGERGFRGPVATYMLVPQSGGGATGREVEIATRAVRSLYFHLSDWNSIRVVGLNELDGPLADLQLAGLALPSISLSDARKLAEHVGASHVIQIQALVLGDSMALVAEIRERGEPDQETRVIREDGREDQLEVVTAGLALEILGLHGEPAEYADLVNRSQNHAAQQQFGEGQVALYDWRLAEAEEHFRAAVEQDSAFALAHHYLAQTLYWRTARDQERLWDLGPEIEHHARRAVQYDVEGRLRPGERRHVDAFRAFWTGGYETARRLYDSILSFNPTDLEGLILRGSVELADPWLTRDREGTLLPRLDLDLARAMYDSAARLNSQWQLAWGRLYDIDIMLAETAFNRRCVGFHPPEYEESLTPYSIGEASVISMYCPLIEGDSAAWVPSEEWDEFSVRAQASVRQVHDQTVQRLERWAQVEKDQPRHHEELADWLLWERSILGCSAEQVEADSLAGLALVHLDRALALRGDTTPEDRVRLAAIGMLDGDYEASRRAMDEALLALGDWRSREGPTPPNVAMNPYMAVGEIQPVLDLIEAIYGSVTAAVPDPADPDDVIDMTGSFGLLYALGALGYLGQAGPVVKSRLDELARLWAGERYTDRHRAVLHSAGLSLAGPALVEYPELWDDWVGDLEDPGLDVPAAWRGLTLAESEPDRARELLEEALADLERERGKQGLSAVDFFLPMMLAQRIGSDSLAVDLRQRALKCPLALHVEDFGWGMRMRLAGDGH